MASMKRGESKNIEMNANVNAKNKKHRSAGDSMNSASENRHGQSSKRKNRDSGKRNMKLNARQKKSPDMKPNVQGMQSHDLPPLRHHLDAGAAPAAGARVVAGVGSERTTGHMKALTLWQPWASLIAWGEKQYETRSWPTTYRGHLAIHASKNDDGWEVCQFNSFYQQALERAGIPHFDNLPLGMILCIVDLVDVQQVREVDRGVIFGKMLDQKEENFGDYSHGRYAWKLENVRVLFEPIPCRGYQGLWDWNPELATLEWVK